MTPVLIIVGPSGVGKSSVMSHLRELGVVQLVPTWTTRAPRSYEQGAMADHVFVDDVTFDDRERQGYFMATTSLFGLRYRYGLPHRRHWEDTGGVPVVMLRSMLMPEIVRHFEAFHVYQIEAPRERVAAHMRQRQQEEGDIGTRLELFSREIAAGRQIAQRCFDNDGSPRDTAEAIWRCLREDFSQHECPA